MGGMSGFGQNASNKKGAVAEATAPWSVAINVLHFVVRADEDVVG
jgi:hypothetical protein